MQMTTKAALTAAAALLAAGGSAAFAGTALAGGHDCGCNTGGEHHSSSWGKSVGYHRSTGTTGTGGSGGTGGNSNANCAVPIGASVGVIGQGGPVKQCNATAGGGGNGGNGVSY